jgi:A/G-specific adenine glycosylase
MPPHRSSMINPKRFHRALLSWYRQNGRDLPWRNTRNPYRILVSEFMLQQTQVASVLPYFEKWLRHFPSFAALASAKQNDALHAWQGLGYYARARNLHAAAKLLVDRHGGRFPESIDEMRALPGVGKYTAHAVATFAFDQPVPIVETNTSRVLCRLFNLRIPIDSNAGQEILWNRAAFLVPKKQAAVYNSALLDLGALVCLPRNPKCNSCPVKRFCRAKSPKSLPIKRPRPATKRFVERHAFILKNNKLLLTKAINRWREMWILPPINRHPQYNGVVYKALFPFTNHQITLQVFRRPSHEITGLRQRWFSRRELSTIPIPSPHRRAINALLIRVGR